MGSLPRQSVPVWPSSKGQQEGHPGYYRTLVLGAEEDTLHPPLALPPYLRLR